ncbi:MAG: hypothetical protein ACK5O1_05325 [Holosporales bacterium]|jgi:hypothetical protein
MVFVLQKSALFTRQAREAVLYYKAHAGVQVAGNFVFALEKSLNFIRDNPYACSAYDAGDSNPALQEMHFRRWHVYRFPYWIFFHLQGDTMIFVDGLYGQRQDVAKKLPTFR